jgi:hypothetical protein
MLKRRVSLPPRVAGAEVGDGGKTMRLKFPVVELEFAPPGLVSGRTSTA